MEIFIIAEVILLFLTYTQTSRNRRKYFIICCLILFVINGMHYGKYNVYNDYWAYMNFFNGKGSMYGSMDIQGDYDLEPTYLYFCKFLRLFGKDDFIYVAGMCLMVGIPFMWMTYKKSVNPPLTLFLLFTILGGGTYAFYLYVHRQMVATAFMIWALIIYESDIRYKKIWALLFLFIGLIGHSSSYFAIPILLFVYFFRIELSKRSWIIICLTSMVLGIAIFKFFSGSLTSLFFALGGIEEIERSTHYLIDSDYTESDMAWKRIMLFTGMVCSMLYFSTKKEANSFGMKMMVVSMIIFNLLGTLPHAVRLDTGLILFGIAGFLPSAFRKDNLCRLIMLAFLLMHFYITVKGYMGDGFNYPFHFIWEK